MKKIIHCTSNLSHSFVFSAPLDHVAYYVIARDIALGMNYLHQHHPSVLHLDLKSMNVLLTQHLRAKIADFGFSKLRYDIKYSLAINIAESGTGGAMRYIYVPDPSIIF